MHTFHNHKKNEECIAFDSETNEISAYNYAFDRYDLKAMLLSLSNPAQDSDNRCRCFEIGQTAPVVPRAQVITICELIQFANSW